MVKKKMAICLSLAVISSAHVSRAADPITVPIPAWHEQIDGLVAALSTVSDLFKQSENFYNEWDANLKPLHQELANRNSERKAVLACAQKKLQEKLATISLLNTDIAERNTIIAQLRAQVAYLESEINRLNIAIQNKQAEKEQTRLAYEEVIGENAEKANEFLQLIAQLQGEYANLVRERNEFRGNLEDFYGALQAHTLAAREDTNAATQSICN